METLLIVLIIVCLMFIVFNVLTYFVDKKKSGPQRESTGLNDKFVFESIVYARSGLRGVYTGILIITSVLTILGIRAYGDIKTTVDERVRDLVKGTYKVNSDSLRQKDSLVTAYMLDAKTKLKDFTETLQALQGRYRNAVPRNLHVVVAEFIGESGHDKILFSNLTAIGGEKLKFSKPPVVFADFAIKEYKSIKPYVEFNPPPTTESFEVYGPPGTGYNLWIYEF
jgi:hypothetical protein